MPGAEDDARSTGQAVMRPIQVSSAVDGVADRLVTAVALGAFTPGERLPGERELARMLGVGRSTVREALVRLRAVGVIETRRGRTGGAFVLRSWSEGSATAVRSTLLPQWQDLEDLFDLRGLVESTVARAAAERRDESATERIEAAVAAFADARTPQTEHAADAALHGAILAAAGNPHLAELSGQLLARVSFGLAIEPYTKGVHSRALAEHRALAAAVVQGRVEDAGRLARAHFTMSEERFRDALHRSLRPTAE